MIARLAGSLAGWLVGAFIGFVAVRYNNVVVIVVIFVAVVVVIIIVAVVTTTLLHKHAGFRCLCQVLLFHFLVFCRRFSCQRAATAAATKPAAAATAATTTAAALVTVTNSNNKTDSFKYDDCYRLQESLIFVVVPVPVFVI